MSDIQIAPVPVLDETLPDSRQRSTLSDILGPVIVFVFFIGIWYLLSTVILPEQKRFLLPTPHKVITEGFGVWRSGERRGLQPILLSVWDTAKIALIGLGITIVVGMSVAILMSASRWLERATWPYLVAVQSAPVLALTPLIRALIDNTRTQRLLVVVLIAVFPIVSNTLFGLLSADKSQHEIFTLQGASRWVRLTKLQFPAALPNIFVGLRISAGLAVIGAVVGDFYFRQGGVVGIGAQIDVYRNRLWGPELITAIIMASALGLVVFLFSDGSLIEPSGNGTSPTGVSDPQLRTTNNQENHHHEDQTAPRSSCHCNPHARCVWRQ